MNCREIYPNRSARDFILEHLNKKVGLLHIIKLLSRKSHDCVLCRKKLVQENHRLFVRWASCLQCLEENDCSYWSFDRAEEASRGNVRGVRGLHQSGSRYWKAEFLQEAAICMRTVKQNCNPDGSRQEAIWGANWTLTQDIVYESLINIRPRQNRAMEILDAGFKEQVAQVIQQLLGGLGRRWETRLFKIGQGFKNGTYRMTADSSGWIGMNLARIHRFLTIQAIRRR